MEMKGDRTIAELLLLPEQQAIVVLYVRMFSWLLQ